MMNINTLVLHDSTNISLKERAYKCIKENIISCVFPPGSLLNEKDLVEQIGASRTPIREALSRLEQEQLVMILPQRGSFVTDITPKTINDVYQAREMLEPGLVRLVTPVIAEASLLEFQHRFEQLAQDDYEAAIVADSDFHNFVLKSCNNDYLIQLMENMYAQNERIRILMVRKPQRLRETTEEHLAIISAMLRRDEAGAAEAMRSHMRNARQSAIKFQYGYFE